tara:strand:- start:1099 stop:2004 length:906 start_codon:yes stop_codon:yes gene_type:complete
MGEKPSFKIKKFKNAATKHVHFGTFSCGGVGAEVCPLHQTSNEWVTNKVTLNNQVQDDGEIDAQAALRRVAPGALAVQTRVHVYRGDDLQSVEVYVLLETVDDDAFVEKWFGGDFSLYERERTTGVEFERFGGTVLPDQPDDEEDVEDLLSAPAHLNEIAGLRLSDFDELSVASHFALEKFVNHWDGACRGGNHYIAYNGTKYHMIASGMDQTYQCTPTSSLGTLFVKESDIRRDDNCGVGNECYRSASCRSLYNAKLAQLRTTPGARRPHCPDWAWVVSTSVAVGVIFPALLLVATRKFA